MQKKNITLKNVRHLKTVRFIFELTSYYAAFDTQAAVNTDGRPR